MNYTFMKRCVENRIFAPIQQQWLDSIDALIPGRLKKNPDANQLLQELYAKVTDEFHKVVVKHTGTLDLYFIYILMYITFN